MHCVALITGRTCTIARRPGLALALALVLPLASGCGKKDDKSAVSVSKPPVVKVIKPAVRNLIRHVGQPSFIESFERTSIYPKLTGYIERWIVDIGDRVKKGDTLATLFVPELVEDFGTKKATVVLDEQRVELAKKMVEVASADTRAARARLEEAQAILGKYQAEADRWDTQVKRLTRETSRGVVDAQILLESTNQLKSSIAARDAAGASIRTADAEVLAYDAKLGKARVDVAVAGADLAVATSDAKRIEAWVGYITLSAPFDGIIVARNANSSDFVKPGEGDPTADPRSPYRSPSGASAPIYVVARTDVVRVFVDIPEQDANYVHPGSTASVVARAYRDQPIKGTVTRTSWDLNIKSRTLRAEIDLPNTNMQLLPGMYAYATVVIERPNVHAIPISATTHTGDQTYCWLYDDGHAHRAEIRTGVSDGEFVEVTSLNQSKSVIEGEMDQPWVPFTGSEQVIIGDLSILTEDAPVDLHQDQPPASAPKPVKPATADNSRSNLDLGILLRSAWTSVQQSAILCSAVQY